METMGKILSSSRAYLENFGATTLDSKVQGSIIYGLPKPIDPFSESFHFEVQTLIKSN